MQLQVTSAPADPSESQRRVHVYVASPAKQITGATSTVIPRALMDKIAAVEVAYLDMGVEVYAATGSGHWRSREDGEGHRAPSPFRAMAAADLVVAYVPAALPPTIGVELGWASALRKPIVLLVDNPGQHGDLLGNLETATSVLPLTNDPYWTPAARRKVLAVALDWHDDATAVRYAEPDTLAEGMPVDSPAGGAAAGLCYR